MSCFKVQKKKAGGERRRQGDRRKKQVNEHLCRQGKLQWCKSFGTLTALSEIKHGTPLGGRVLRAWIGKRVDHVRSGGTQKGMRGKWDWNN